MHETMDENGRRVATVELGGRKYRVTEAPPSKGYRVISMAERLAGSIVLKVMAGQIVDKKSTPCPKCGGNEPQSIGRDEWLCRVVVGQDGPRIKYCGEIWPQERELDEHGKPHLVTLESALESAKWRPLIFKLATDALERQTPDEASDLMEEVLLGNMEMHIAGDPPHDKWVQLNTMADIDRHIPSASVLKQLVNAAMIAWVLPTAAAGWSMRHASPAAKTDGGSEAATPSPALRTPGPPHVRVNG